MEEYLQYMKTLRSQMNDVEDQAAKASVEEQMQITTIETMEKDLNSAKSEAKQLEEDTMQIMKAKGEICTQILEKQRKIASLESDTATLTQTLELIQQEQISLSTKLAGKSSYYVKVAEDINTQLQQQQIWVNSNKVSREMGQRGPYMQITRVLQLKDKIEEKFIQTEGNFSTDKHLIKDNLDNEARRNLMDKLDSGKAKLDEISRMKTKLVTENSKTKQSIDHVRFKANDFKPQLLVMDIMILEEEYRALLSDKSGETEYLQSLQDQIKKLKGISHVIKCGCGEEYKVEMDLHA